MANFAQSSPSRAQIAITMVAMLLIALNLRLAIAAVGPVIENIRLDLAMSHGIAGLLTTLPLVCFGVLSPVATYLGGRFGTNATLLAALASLLIGIVIRSAGGAPVVLAGTVLLGAGLAIGNVLVPVLIKTSLSSVVGLAMGLYSAFLAGGAAVGAVGTTGLAAAGWDWRAVLAADAVPVVIAIALFWWWWRRSSVGRVAVLPSTSGGAQVWRSATPWQLACFMGGQSFQFYCLLSWLPAVLRQHGVSVATAGSMLSIYSIVGIAGALLMPLFASRVADGRIPALLSVGGWVVGVTGLLLLPDWYVLWSVELGVAQGAGIALALMLIVTLSADTSVARHMSGMVQSVGYVVAAIGPWLFGALRDATANWTVSLVMLLVVSGLILIPAWLVGRGRVVRNVV